MDHLDNTLKLPDEVIDQRTPRTYIMRKMYWAIVGYGLVTNGYKVLRHRKDVVRKVNVGKSFYKYWVPFILIGAVFYPLDRYAWDAINGQVRFWQTSIFYLDKNPKFSNKI
jgi:hypothetical protein